MTSSTQPSPETTEEYFKKFHQWQGHTTHCADFSISMACNIYCAKMGKSAEGCAVEQISGFLDRFFFMRFRFPNTKGGIIEGGATPCGVIAALLRLGIPFRFNLFGTLGGLEKVLRDGKMVIVSQGKIRDPKVGTRGHVVLVVGETDSVFLVLDPGIEDNGVSRRDKRAFINDWWYTPIHPCWVIG
jgi:hypothetical protein